MKMSNRLATVVISIMVVATLLPIASLEAGTGVNDPRISTDKSNYSVGDNVIVTVSNTLNGSIRVWYCLLDTRNSACTNDKKWIMYKSSETRHYFGPMSDAWANKWLKIIAENTTRSTWSNEIYMQISPRSGSNPTTNSFNWPISNASASQTFGNKTSSPPNQTRTHHAGVDLTGGSTVYSTGAGTVSAVGWNDSNGNYVVVKHTISGATVYAHYFHLRSYDVTKGQSVNQSTKIGVMGNTGRSFGTHLHFAFASSGSGSLYGYVPAFSGNKTTYSGVTYYNPNYVVDYDRLP